MAVALGPHALASLGGVSGGDTTTEEALAICLNAAVFLVVGFVTSSLAGRYRESQAHLDAHRKHLSDLQAFRDLIFESVGSGLVGVDPRGRVTAFNRAAESITGFRSGDALGQPWSAIFGSGVDLDEIRETANEDQSPPRRYEFPLRRQDGRLIPVGISFWSLRAGDGEVAGLVGVCQDLSAIKQMEQRMRQADRLATVGRLSANMAHEIRNPLASISGAVEALAKDLPPDEGRNRLVEIVLRESERLNHIVGAFLEYARPAPLTPIDVDLAQILDEVLLLIEHGPLPENLKIMREYAESLPARVDPSRCGRRSGTCVSTRCRPCPTAARCASADRRWANPSASRSRYGSPTAVTGSPMRTCPTSSSRSTRPRRAGSAWRLSIASCRTTAASSRRAAGRGRDDLHLDAPRGARAAERSASFTHDEAPMSSARVLVVDDERACEISSPSRSSGRGTRW